MTLTFELDLDTFVMNQHAKFLGQRLFHSEVIVRMHRHAAQQAIYSIWDHDSGW